MSHLLKLTACVILIQGLYTTDAQAIGGCVDQLTASLSNGTENCVAVTDYFKCIFLETNLYKTRNKSDLTRFKAQFEAALADRDINCHIDVMAIAEELLENDRKGIVHTTARPKGYKNAKTAGECIDTYMAEAAGGFTCDRLTLYLKCIIRVSNLHKPTSNHTDEDIQTLQQSVEDSVEKLNTECDINIAALIYEVRREEGIEDGSNFTQGSQGNGADLTLASLSVVKILMLTFAALIMVY